MTVLEAYLRSLHNRRGRTVPETGQYGELETLLNSAGDEVRPSVIALTHPNRSEAGIPDLGLYDEHQVEGQKPARGVIEVKPTNADLITIANSRQVATYLAAFGQVLVTNLFQFIHVTRAVDGTPNLEERYDLAADESTFWRLDPHILGNEHDATLREYFKRVMRRNAPLASPQDVAWILASYARVARKLVEQRANLTALQQIRNDLQTALGIEFLGEAGDHLFRSTLIQTLFYGVFSAWVLWHDREVDSLESFNLWSDTRHLNIPIIRDLFYQLTAPDKLKPLGLEPLLDWTSAALNRVETSTFFAAFEQTHAIQYFYEPFLKEFDPELRKQLGVWYTPAEIVQYMVARVHNVLQTELGIVDGLADERVVVLDPACGTGTYLGSVCKLS